MKLKKTTKILLLSATLPCVAVLAPMFSLIGCNKKTPDKLEHVMRAEISGDTDLKIEQKFKWEADLSISTDGKEWIKINKNQTLHFKKGDKVYFSGNNPTGLFKESGNSLNFKFESNPDAEPTVKLCGSVMSLIDGEGKIDTIPNVHCFAYLFKDSTAIKEIDKDFLSAKHLTIDCYAYMFAGCKKITNIPVGLLPVQELANGCYQGMFFSCHGLTSLDAGILPSTDLGNYCYFAMFEDCINLENIPAGLLPATKLAKHCYENMFTGTAITIIPQNFLPATELADSCYYSMFAGCKKLWVAPPDLLPATTLAPACYFYMFEDCTSLKNLVNLPAKQLAEKCYYAMYVNCSGLTSIPESFVFNAEIMDRWSCGLMFAECENIKEINPNLFKNVKKLGTACMDAMFDSTGIDTPVELPDDVELAEECFQELYRNVKLKKLPKLVYKNGLKAYCYRAMFRESDLTQVNPDEFKVLNDYETLEVGCFESMFQGAKFPKSVIKNMSDYFNFKAEQSVPWCYKNMFRDSNIESLPKFALKNLDDSTFFGTFANTQIKEIPDTFVLPSIFNDSAFASCKEMFMGCNSLTKINKNLIPQFDYVPEETFSGMFTNCIYLKNPCYIKVKEFGPGSCENMFKNTGIVSLDECIFDTNAILGEACFDSMFAICKDLTTIVNNFLPFTNLEEACYFQMFLECPSLTNAPSLPATSLPRACYQSMFKFCSNLYVTTDPTGATLFLTTPSDLIESTVSDMFANTKNPDMSTPIANQNYYFKTA